MLIAHAILGFLLVTAHSAFLLRGLKLRKTGEPPRGGDKSLKSAAQGLLVPVIITGVLIRSAPTPPLWAFGHAVMGFSPLVLIILFMIFRGWRNRYPVLLPAANALLLTAASVSGLLIILKGGIQ